MMCGENCMYNVYDHDFCTCIVINFTEFCMVYAAKTPISSLCTQSMCLFVTIITVNSGCY